MAKAQLHTTCCEIDACIAEEELEWLSFSDEILYMHILYFMIKSLIFYYSLTHSSTFSRSVRLTTSRKHAHVQLLHVFLPFFIVQRHKINKNKVKQMCELVHRRTTNIIYMYAHAHHKSRQMSLHNICKLITVRKLSPPPLKLVR